MEKIEVRVVRELGASPAGEIEAALLRRARTPMRSPRTCRSVPNRWRSLLSAAGIARQPRRGSRGSAVDHAAGVFSGSPPQKATTALIGALVRDRHFGVRNPR